MKHNRKPNRLGAEGQNYPFRRFARNASFVAAEVSRQA
jgi:hypothetical protein